MKLRQRKSVAERRIYKIDFFKKGFCFLHGSTLTEKPRNQFKLSNIILVGGLFFVIRVSYKVQTGYAKTLFVCGVIIKRVIVWYICHTYYCIMGFHCSHMPKVKRIVTGSYGNFVAIGKFIVQCSAKIKILRFIGYCRAHKIASILLRISTFRMHNYNTNAFFFQYFGLIKGH